MLLYSFFVSFAVILLAYIKFGKAEHISLSALQDCLNDKIGSRKFRRLNPTDFFSLYYGDPAVEVFNAFSSHDIKRTEYMASCIQELEKDSFELSSTSIVFDQHNVTTITPYIFSTYPDIFDTITKAIVEGLREAESTLPVPQLSSILSVKLIEFDSPIKMPSPDELFKQAKEASTPQAFIISPHPVEEHSDDTTVVGEPEAQADINVIKKMTLLPKNRMLAIIPFSDRLEYTGGQIYIKKKKIVRSVPRHRILPDEILDEEEDEATQEYDLHPQGTSLVDVEAGRRNQQEEGREPGRRRRSTNMDRALNVFYSDDDNHEMISMDHKYNVLTSHIARYSPEKHEILVVFPDTFYGMEAITRGKKKICFVEFDLSL